MQVAPSPQLSGQPVLITGAAQGMGRATALAIAREGGHPILVDRDAEHLSTLAQEIALLSGDLPSTYCIDVTDALAFRKVCEGIQGRYGSLYGLVTCAGILRLTDILACSLEEWHDVLEINLTGTFLACQAALPLIMKNGSGRIVTVSSTAGKQGGILSGIAYNAAKGGVLALTKSLARQFAPQGITVNCVCPGPTDTAMSRQFDEEQRRHLISLIPLGRLADAGEIAAAIVFLLSDSARYITGEMLDVSGGLIID
ncbi:MAG: SDR family oxidoreductase [Chloroflexi bacterium]|nr:SDR family oxidoreductase [Chloroflexota bacterium]